MPKSRGWHGTWTDPCPAGRRRVRLCGADGGPELALAALDEPLYAVRSAAVLPCDARAFRAELAHVRTWRCRHEHVVRERIPASDPT